MQGYFNKNGLPIQLGKKHSEKDKELISNRVRKAYKEGKKLGFQKGHKRYLGSGNKKGFHASPKTEFKKGLIPWNKGIPISEETKKKMMEALPDRKGKNHPNWKGGITDKKRYKRENRARKYNAEGFHTNGEWELLKKQYGYKCPACEKIEPTIKLTEDHIVPLVRGGSDNIENIQPLCKSCNSRKHTKIIKY